MGKKRRNKKKGFNSPCDKAKSTSFSENDGENKTDASKDTNSSYSEKIKSNQQLPKCNIIPASASAFSILNNAPNTNKPEELHHTPLNKQHINKNQNRYVSDKSDTCKAVNPVSKSNLNQQKKNSLHNYPKVFDGEKETDASKNTNSFSSEKMKLNQQLPKHNVISASTSAFSILNNAPNINKAEELHHTPLNKQLMNKNQNRYVSDKSVTCKAVNPVSKSNLNQEKRDSLHNYPTVFDTEKNNEFVDSTSNCFQPNSVNQFQNKRDSELKNNCEKLKMKENFVYSVNRYKNSKTSFSEVYYKWLPERRNTLVKLRSLLREVHDSTMEYNKAQATFKELSYNSRCFQAQTENQTINFFTSLTTFLSDAASGVTSFAQTFNVDSYKFKFKEIMDYDTEITKNLYASRSQCFGKYRGIEEVIRKYQFCTLTSTANEISGELKIDKHWTNIKNAYQNDDMSKLLNEVSSFFDNACQSEVLGNIGDSIHRYVDDNPFALEACKSTGKAAYGALNSLEAKKGSQTSVERYVNSAANLYLMQEDKIAADRLRCAVRDDTYDSKLESQIEEAVESLESEMKEMNNMYFQLFYHEDSD